MAVALFAPFTAMLISSIWLGVWSASEIEKLLRFALAVPVCWMLLRAPRHWLQHVQWSVLFGAYAGSIMLFVILLHPAWDGDLYRTTAGATTPLPSPT